MQALWWPLYTRIASPLLKSLQRGSRGGEQAAGQGPGCCGCVSDRVHSGMGVNLLVSPIPLLVAVEREEAAGHSCANKPNGSRGWVEASTTITSITK